MADEKSTPVVTYLKVTKTFQGDIKATDLEKIFKDGRELRDQLKAQGAVTATVLVGKSKYPLQ